MKYLLRRNLIVCGLTASLAGGCASNQTSSAGWRLEYLKPPTIQQPLVVSSGPAPVGLVGSATYGNQPLNYIAPQAPTAYLPPPPAPRYEYVSPRAVPGDCASLEEACARIRALESARPTTIDRITPERLRMPTPAAVPAPVPVAPKAPCE